MTLYVLALSTEDNPVSTVQLAEALMDSLVAEHVEAGYAPPDKVDIGLTRGEYIAYASMTKSS